MIKYLDIKPDFNYRPNDLDNRLYELHQLPKKQFYSFNLIWHVRMGRWSKSWETVYVLTSGIRFSNYFQVDMSNIILLLLLHKIISNQIQTTPPLSNIFNL